MFRISITFRLLSFITIAFLLTTISVLILANNQLKDIIDTSQSEVYSEKLEAILRALDRNFQRLRLTEMVDAYEEDFQTSAIQTLREIYYKFPERRPYPIIVGDDGKIILHPKLPKGDLSIANTEYIKKVLRLENGEFNYVYKDGSEYWIIFRYYKAWKWNIFYSLPLDVKYADVRRFRRILVGILGSITFFVLAGLALTVTRFTKPITRLTKISTEMAQGNLDIPIQTSGKDELAVLSRSFVYMRNSIREKISELEKENMERRLAQSEQSRLTKIIESTSDMVYSAKTDNTLMYMNRFGRKMLGWSEDEDVHSKKTSEIHPMWAYQKIEEEGIRLATEHGVWEGETAVLGAEGKELPVSQVIMSHKSPSGSAEYFSTIIRDITAQRNLEEQLRHTQKMEALGTLAGGIAHDFNNILMGIQGRVSLLNLDAKSTPRFLEHLRGIEGYVKSAANLTKRLLGVARGGKYEVKTIDLNALIKNENQLFGRTWKEINIIEKLNRKLWAVDVDKGQIEQVLLNIYVNARQAMPKGGRLDIQTENITIKDTLDSAPALGPGKYVKISIADTGIGMDEETRKRVFDPFFTTKEMGRGTGLGLASAYGIVKSHGGFICVSSELGKGAAFDIYFPASEKIPVEEKEVVREMMRGTETILLVDDEDMIIEVEQELLETLGHTVIPAKGGEEALKVFESRKSQIDMVILDLIMPGMGGEETYEKLKEIDSNVRVLLSSGYSVNGQARKIIAQGCDGFIQKPFDIEELSVKIRDILG